MSSVQGDIVDQAIAWHLRLPGADEGEWTRFVEWLEADPAHSAAYDAIVDDEALAAPMLDLEREGQASVVRVEQASHRWNRRSGWMAATGMAVAASIAAMIYVPHKPADPAGTRTIATAPGEKREVALADGTRVEMNGGSELRITGGDARQVSLTRGQAVFHVRHDEKAPFEVAVGDVVLRDVGTVFDVTHEAGRLVVQVAEGAVTYQPEHEALTLRGGMALATRDGDDRLVVTHIPAESVGGWRQGRLTFRETPLRAVAASIRRTSGADLVTSEKLASMPFTGSIRLVGDARRDAEHVAALVGAHVRREGRRWILTSGSDAPG